MIERAAAAEVVSIDERHRQAALGGVARDGKAANAATHDQNVERVGGEARRISLHA